MPGFLFGEQFRLDAKRQAESITRCVGRVAAICAMIWRRLEPTECPALLPRIRKLD
jgi:hypothetical protein